MKNLSLRPEIELFKFYLAIYGFKRKGGSERTLKAGADLLKRRTDIRNNIIKSIVSPLTEDVQVFKTLPNVLRNRLRGSAGSEEQAVGLGEIFYSICLYYSSRTTKVKETLTDSKERGYFLSALQACSKEGVSLNILMGDNLKDKRLKKWVEKASVEVKESTLTEVKVNQLKEIETISKAIKLIESRIKSPDTTDIERISLLKEKEKRMQSLESATEKMGEDSPAALAVVTSILSKKSDHLTDTGKKQGLSTEQEDVLVSKGELEVSAGAGSGKTKVIASKVAYTIQELNVPSDKMIVVSSTKESSDNLREKVISYSGANSTGRFVGVTPESVAFSILDESGYLRDKNLILEEDLSEWVDASIEQVRQGEGSEAPVKQAMLRKASIGEDPRLKPLLIKVARVIAEKAYLTEAPNLLSLVSPAVKEISDGEIKLADGSDSIWDDLNFRSSINDYISTFQGKEILKSAKPYSQFSRFASIGSKPPKLASGRNEWFNLGFDPMSNVSKPNTNEMKKYILQKQKQMVSASDLWAKRDKNPPLSINQLEKRIEEDMKIATYGAFEYLKKEQGSVDRRDYALLASQALIDNPKILEKMNEKYSHIFIDEAQDLSKSEKTMFDLIAGSLDPKTLTPKTASAESYLLIGDSNQKNTKTASEAKKAVLTTNYRSRLNIVEAANNIISPSLLSCEASPYKDGGEIYYKICEEGLSPGKEEITQEIKQKVEFEGWVHDNENHKFGIVCRSEKEVVGYALELMINKVSCSTKHDILDTGSVNALTHILGIKSNNPLTQYKSVCNIHKYLDFNLPEDFNDYLNPEGESVLDALLNESFAFSKSKEVKSYVDYLMKVIEYEGDLESLLEYLAFEIKDADDEELFKKNLLTKEEMLFLEKEAMGEKVSSYEKLEYLKSGLGLVARIFSEKDWMIEEGLDYMESMKKVSKMSSKERDLNRVLIRTCEQWKGLECRDIYVSMTPTRFPRIGLDLQGEEKLGYLAITRGQDKVKVLCGGDTPYLVEKACLLSEEEFLNKTSQPKSASFVDAMTLWLEENQ